MQIQQAIFTSARTSRMDGYQLVVASAEVSQTEATELVRWGPTHDSLQESRTELSSVNFHPLVGDSWCVSRTVAAGPEYSGRGGPRIYTYCLIVRGDVLLHFANNPFRILEAALGSGNVAVSNELPDQLPSIQLVGSASIVDSAALSQFVRTQGTEPLVELLDAAISNSSLALLSSQSTKLLFSLLINLLPMECRREMSFTTGLKHTPSRPYRLISASNDAVNQGRALRKSEPTLLNLDKQIPTRNIENAWAALTLRLLREESFEEFADLLRVSRTGLMLADLDRLGHQLESQIT